MVGPSRAEVWIIDLRGSRGHEQKGARPGIIWRDLDHLKMAIVIPCTTSTGTENFPHTHLISPTSGNGFSEDSVAMLFQMVSIDKKRLTKKLGELDKEDIRGIILKLEPKTEFEELGEKFYTIFKRKKIQEKFGEKVTIKVTDKVTKNQKRILELISIDMFVTVRELSFKVGISERKIKENISKLKQKGLLKRIGPAKGGHWEVLK